MNLDIGPCPHLEPCPWCGVALEAVWRKSNPRASCKSEGCFGRKMAVVNLDDPADVFAWNQRAALAQPAPVQAGAQHAVAELAALVLEGRKWPGSWANGDVSECCDCGVNCEDAHKPNCSIRADWAREERMKELATALAAPTQAGAGDAVEPTLADAIEHFGESDAWRVALETHLDILEAENRELRVANAQSATFQASDASLSASEQRAVLADLMGLECLINYHDCQEAGADAMEPGCVAGNAKRALQLLSIGREIIARDADLWADEQKCAFALRHSERAALKGASPSEGDA